MASQTDSYRVTVKETVTSIVIAFVMAFVARGFVVEAFLIPTGSMAPTLMGAHIEVTSPSSGYTWPVGPWDYMPGTDIPLPIQGSRDRAVTVTDPMTQETVVGPYGYGLTGMPRLAGDRIFVLKYLYSVFDPQRFDVVVFKNPCNPSVNFIKRLIGLPGEEVALVDGDVFVRRTPGVAAKPANPSLPVSGLDTWYGEGWAIARKPERVQRSVWQPVFDSSFTPRHAMAGDPSFRCPWKAETEGWNVLRESTSYTHKGGLGVLSWDENAHPINDYYPYNQAPNTDQIRTTGNLYPVSDVRVSFGIEPAADGTAVSTQLTTRGHEFRATIDAQGAVSVSMRREPRNESEEPEWTVLGSGTTRALPKGVATNLEFWFVDQTVQVWVEGERVGYGEYNWNIQDRVWMTLAKELKDVLAGKPQETYDAFVHPAMYPKPEVRVEFTSKQGVTLHRVALDRDLFYEPARYHQGNDPRDPHTKRGQPALATHPLQTPSLGPDEFFVCGDNSPASSDARLWDAPDPWVAEKVDETTGVVARELLIGRAFFVYFPSLHSNHNVPVPDFGRMRWIW